MPRFRRKDEFSAVQYIAGWPPPVGVTPPDNSVDPPTPAFLTTKAGEVRPLADGDWITDRGDVIPDAVMAVIADRLV